MNTLGNSVHVRRRNTAHALQLDTLQKQRIIANDIILKGSSLQHGLDGVNGLDGVDGADGTDGRKGDKGDRGLDGVDGVDGVDGQKGGKGDRGPDGVFIDDLRTDLHDLDFRMAKSLDSIPTNTSDLTNDGANGTNGFITIQDVAQQNYITSASLPTHTSDLINDEGFITSSSLPTSTTDF